MAWKLSIYRVIFLVFCVSLLNTKAEDFTTNEISISLSKTLNIDLERGRDFRFGFAAKVDKSRSDKKIAGSNLWKVGAWFSSSEDGSGDTIGFFDQLLTSAQSGSSYRKSARLTITGVSYSLPPMRQQCSDIRYFCVRFGATDSPQLASGQTLDVSGFPDDSVLTACVETPGCTENGNICFKNDIIYDTGDSWNPDSCTECTCTPAGVNCPREVCQPLSCAVEYQIHTPGVCCSTCPTSCQVDDNTYDIGSSWQHDVCTRCTCLADGSTSCSTADCLLPSCPGGHQPITHSDMCCPVCPLECEDNGVTHFHRDHWDRDVCTSCDCSDGTTQCDVEICPTLACSESTQIKAEDLCCAECGLDCLYSNSIYEHGASWTLDVCTACSCDNGTYDCVTQNCPVLLCPAEQTLTRTGDCCAVCGDECEDDGVIYAHLEKWSPTVCSSCNCVDGAIQCSVESCPRLNCDVSTQIKAHDQCCAECAVGCAYERSVYEHGASWNPDACTVCSCDNGTDDCIIQTCSDTQCPAEQTLTRTGECCAVCGEGCRYDGQEFNHIDRWSPDPCTSCECNDGFSACAVHSCAVPSCGEYSRVVTLEGECCPSCSEGPSLILRSNVVKIKFKKNTKLRLGAKRSKLKFTPIIIFENTDTEVTGSNMWHISVWLSSEADGNSKLGRIHSRPTLSNRQSSIGMTPYKRLNLGLTKVRFNIRRPKCKQLNYVCIRFDLTENPLAVGFSLFLDTSSVVQTCAPIPTCREFKE